MFQLRTLSLLLLSTILAVGFVGSPKPVAGQTVLFQTNVGDVEVQLHPNDAPIAVANFLSYVNAPAGSNYDGTFIHRSITNFVIQGGGFFLPVDGVASEVPSLPPIVNEFGISNTRGTLAFAKIGGDPDSATNQWFFNTQDNSENLDVQNGGFTVFGTVVSGLNIVDQIQATPLFDFGGVFNSVPLLNKGTEFVVVNTITVVPVLLGDVNLDGAVDFSDIPAFIELLQAGEYLNEADADQSASVDFQDIASFIDILISQ